MSFMVVAALLPTLIETWSLSNTQAGWLGGIFFAGFIGTVPVLAGLTDRVDPKRIYLVSALVGAAGSIGFGVFADGFWSALFWRFLAGIGLAGTYTPALKAMGDQLPDRLKGRATGYYASMFALGSAVSFIVGGEAAALFGWRWAFVISGLGSVVAFVIVLVVLPARPPDPRRSSQPLAFGPVLRNRPVMGYVVANFGGVFESIGMRTWVVPYLVFLNARTGEAAKVVSETTITAIIAIIGVLGALALSEIGARLHLRGVVITAAVLSLALGLASGAAVGQAFWLVVGLLVICAVFNYGRTGPGTAGAVVHAEPARLGATMGVYSFIGFSGGLLGPVAFGTALDAAGGREEPSAWIWGFAAVAAGAAITIVGLAFLKASPGESRFSIRAPNR